MLRLVKRPQAELIQQRLRLPAQLEEFVVFDQSSGIMRHMQSARD
jgi:hypothetical protein